MTEIPTPVRSWSTPSSKLDGDDHLTVLWSDGALTCSCPGWWFSRDGKPKTCKHVRRGPPDQVASRQSEC
jgi:hypothetical protein